MISRSVKESPIVQGVEEQVPYNLTTTPWGSAPGSVSVKVYDLTSGGTDVTTTVMPTNNPTVNGDVITLSVLKSLTTAHVYRVEIKFTCAGIVYETWCEVRAEA